MSVTSKEFVLSHVVKDISTLNAGGTHDTEIEEYFGVSWKMSIKEKDGYFALYLHSTDCNTEEWSMDVEIELRLMSANGKKLSQSTTQTFWLNAKSEKTTLDHWGYPEFIKWEDMEKEYVIDDKVTIEAQVTITKMTGIGKKKLRLFDETAKELSDCVLDVKGQKFYVSKLFLASQSSYFKALFSEPPCDLEITITDAEPNDFQNFLEVLHGEPAIDDNTVDGILHLADMYYTHTVIRKCEEFLLRESEKTLKNKLKLSSKYNLKNSKNIFLLKVKTVEDIRSVLIGDPSEMDSFVLASLLQKSLSFQ